MKARHLAQVRAAMSAKRRISRADVFRAFKLQSGSNPFTWGERAPRGPRLIDPGQKAKAHAKRAARGQARYERWLASGGKP